MIVKESLTIVILGVNIINYVFIFNLLIWSSIFKKGSIAKPIYTIIIIITFLILVFLDQIVKAWAKFTDKIKKKNVVQPLSVPNIQVFEERQNSPINIRKNNKKKASRLEKNNENIPRSSDIHRINFFPSLKGLASQRNSGKHIKKKTKKGEEKFSNRQIESLVVQEEEQEKDEESKKNVIFSLKNFKSLEVDEMIEYGNKNSIKHIFQRRQEILDEDRGTQVNQDCAEIKINDLDVSCINILGN